MAERPLDRAPVRAGDAPPARAATLAARRAELLGEGAAVAWEMDAETRRFTFVSPDAVTVFGYPLARWYEEPTFWQDSLLHPEDREWCVGFCTTATAAGRDHAFHYRARAADGGVRWIRDVVRVVTDAEGRAARVRGTMVDVTEALATRTGVAGADEIDELDEPGVRAADLGPYRVVLQGDWES